MRLDLLVFDNAPALGVPPRVGGYLLALSYLFLTAWIFWANRREWSALTRSRLYGLAAGLALGPLASGVLLIALPGPAILPVPYLPHVPEAPGAPLLGPVAILLIGGWLGAGPAVLVGALSGLVSALWITGRVLQIGELALSAAVVALLMRQAYRGTGFAWLRRPVVAGVLGGVVANVLAFPSILASTSPGTSAMLSADYAFSLVRAAFLPTLLGWAVAGLLVELAFARVPALRPVKRELLPPPYAHSLTRRFLSVLIPAFLVGMTAVVVSVWNIAVASTTDLTLRQMAHDARTASDAIPDLTLISANLLARFARQGNLLQSGPEDQQAGMVRILNLEELLHATAYFRQLVLFDQAGEPLSAYPPLGGENAVPLVAAEKSCAERAAVADQPGVTHVWVVEHGVPMLSHVEPIRSADGKPVGALLGRVDLRTALEPVVDSLQGTMGAGRGFIVDEQSGVIGHPNPDRLMQPWLPREETVRELDGMLPSGDPGRAYEGLAANGTRQLVYYLEGPAHPWTMVVIVPYRHVRSMAVQVVGPLVSYLGAAGLGLVLVLAVLARWISRPLSSLARAADAMLERDLQSPVSVTGEDEVGRLGYALETMRRALRRRLTELHVLLGVSEGVAASTNLAQGLPPILEGALKATGADGVRLVVAPDGQGSPLTVAGGNLGSVMAPLDGAVSRHVQRAPSLRLDDTAKAGALLDTGRAAGRIGAVLAAPVRTSQGHEGVLWLAYRRPHSFTDSEVEFLTALAGQASVLIDNTRLFQAAEGGRRRLAGILASTSDAVVVTDEYDRVLLLNPAAEAAFAVSASEAIGQPVSEAFEDPALVRLLTGRPDDSSTGEVGLPGGRVLSASVSQIGGDDGAVVGRVAVLRDITRLKDLGEMQSEFLNTVSHDLRGPLTYMRGYVTMLSMIGELSAKQKEFAGKILAGIDQMTQLVEGLLNLAKIESDMDQLARSVDIGQMVESVAAAYRPRAEGKALLYNVEVEDGLPVVIGDPTLLRQAISNLIDNAVQYTYTGSVNVRAQAGDENHVVVEVQDTGPGISRADQVRLFERFYRVKRRESLESKGTGLGLAIVKSIIERRHGGRVWVKSKLGVGSSFFFVLPGHSSDVVGDAIASMRGNGGPAAPPSADPD